MSFKIVIHQKIVKSLDYLEKSHQKKLAAFIEILKEIPLPYKRFDIKKLKGYDNRFRVRLGDFRLIYEIDKEQMLVLILKLERRKHVYK